MNNGRAVAAEAACGVGRRQGAEACMGSEGVMRIRSGGGGDGGGSGAHSRRRNVECIYISV